MFPFDVFTEALCTKCDIPAWLFKVIFWLGYSNSMMNPIIYAASSREFKRAFIRILKCRFRRRPRYFLDEDSSTTTAQVYRFTATKRAPKKSVRIASKQNGSRYRNRNNRESKRLMGNESPIASLRLLHNQRYSKDGDAIEIHEDESPAHVDSSDSEKSDISNELADDVLQELNRESLENGSHCKEGAVNNTTPDYADVRTDSTNVDPDHSGYSSSDSDIEMIHQVPNIIVNNKPFMNSYSPDAMDNQCVDVKPNTGAYFQANEDRIMWL